jgi:hypothetical protein
MVFAANDSCTFKNIEGTVYITLDDMGNITDSIKMDSLEVVTLLNGMKLKRISYSGACNYLCGHSGIFIKIDVIDYEINMGKHYSKTKKYEGKFFIDFGYGCQETKEACLDFNGKDESATLIYSYDNNSKDFLDKIWNTFKEKHKTKIDKK